MKIVAGARIHLGFHNIYNGFQAYGSLGLYIGGIKGGPKVIIEVHPIENVSNIILRGYPKELEGPITKIYEKYCLNQARGVEIKLHTSYRRHVGLGSTTQLIMSALMAIKRTCSLRTSIIKMAEDAKRGVVSGIGLHGFTKGGLIIDAGKPISEKWRFKVPKLLRKITFPENVNVVIVIPRTNYNVPENAEPDLWDMDLLKRGVRYSYFLSHYAFSFVIPGVIYKDLELFRTGINKLQDLIGEFFSRLQGDVYATSETAMIVKLLRRLGSYGAGQSSWGPLAYGFFLQKSKNKTENLLLRELDRAGIDADIYWAEPNNQGALVID